MSQEFAYVIKFKSVSRILLAQVVGWEMIEVTSLTLPIVTLIMISILES